MKQNNKNNSNSVIEWIDYRLPIISMLKHSAVDYPTPKKFKLLVELWFFSWFFSLSSDNNWYYAFNALHCSCRSCIFFY